MKKTILLIFAVLGLTFGSALSQNGTPQYQAERLITDFNGVATNGSNILCYGNYGIITYSLDDGENWKQLNIGDKYSIKKIRAVGNYFYGVTNYSIIKSTNNGLKWKNAEIVVKPV